MATTKIRDMQHCYQRGNVNISKTSQRESSFTSTLNPYTGKVDKRFVTGRQLSDESNEPTVMSRSAKATLLSAHKAEVIAATFRLAHYDLNSKERKAHQRLIRIYTKRIRRLS